MLEVLNKIDLLEPEQRERAAGRQRRRRGHRGFGPDRRGIPALLAAFEAA